MPEQVQGAGSETRSLRPASPKFTAHERELLRILVDVRPTSIKVFTMCHANDESDASDEVPAEESQHTATSPHPPHVDVDAIEPAPPIAEEEAATGSNCQVSSEMTLAANDPGSCSGEHAAQPAVARPSRPRHGILRSSATTTDTPTANPVTAGTTENRTVGFAPGIIQQPTPRSMIGEFYSSEEAIREAIEHSNDQRPPGPPRGPQGHDIHVPPPPGTQVSGETSSESRKAPEPRAQELSDTQAPDSSDTQVHDSSPPPHAFRRFARWMKKQVQRPACSWLFKVCCCQHECIYRPRSVPAH